MINVDLDKSKAIRLRARVNESSVAKVLRFRNSAGDPVDITSFDFELFVYKSVGSSLKFFTLSVGDGLTVQGDDNNELLIEISAARATQKADTYFFRLYSAEEDHTWLNGPFQFHNGEFDSEFEETTITIGGDSDVIIEISGGGGSGEGDVTGPDSSNDGEIVLFDGTTGKAIKSSGTTFTSLAQVINSKVSSVSGEYVNNTDPQNPVIEGIDLAIQTAIENIPPYTASTGLSLVGNDFRLGGTFSSQILLNGSGVNAAYQKDVTNGDYTALFQMGATPYTTTGFSFELLNDDSLYNGDYTAGLQGKGRSFKFGALNYVNPDNESIYLETYIDDLTEDFRIIDNRTPKRGVEYGGTGYVTQSHSLMDKEYGDSHLIGKQLPSTPGVSQNLQSLRWNNGGNTWEYYTPTGGGTGTVTSVSVVNANGFAGSVATATTTPAITISTTINGVLKGNGTVISAAISGTDYSGGTSALATGILKSTTSTGVLSIAVAGTDYLAPNGSGSSLTGVWLLASGGTLTANNVITGPTLSGLTASTESTRLNFNLSQTKTFSTGAITTQREVRFQAPTYAFVGSSTITDSATVSIDGSPIAGTNATLTRRYALWATGGIRSDGDITSRGMSISVGPSDAFAIALQTSGVARLLISSVGRSDWTATAQSAGSVTLATWTAAANTGQTASTDINDIIFNLARTVQFATGAKTTQRAFLIQAPTYGAVGATVTSDAYTFYVDNAPVAGTNMTITRRWAGYFGHRLRVLDDVVIDNDTKGLVLKDSGGVYWRFVTNTSGVMSSSSITL